MPRFCLLSVSLTTFISLSLGWLRVLNWFLFTLDLSGMPFGENFHLCRLFFAELATSYVKTSEYMLLGTFSYQAVMHVSGNEEQLSICCLFFYQSYCSRLVGHLLFLFPLFASHDAINWYIISDVTVVEKATDANILSSYFAAVFL